MGVMVNTVVQAAEPLVTACGRRIDVGQIKVDGPSTGIGRVTLDVGPETGGTSRIWAGLSPAEARELARRLLDQAARTERESASRTGRGAVQVAAGRAVTNTLRHPPKATVDLR